MPDQELLDDFLEALEQAGSPVKNPVLRQTLGWDETQYEAVKAELVARRIVVRGRGRSDTVSLVGAEPAAKPATASRNGKAAAAEPKDKSLEAWIWDAACSIRGAKDAAKYKDYILPLIFTKQLYDVFDDELNRIAEQVGSRAKAFQLVQLDHKLVRFYLPLRPDDPEMPVWSVIRQLADRIGEGVTNQQRAIARENPRLQGIIDRVAFNVTTHGQRDLDDDRLSNLIEAISNKRLGLKDVEADIIGKSYEYLIRKFAEGSGQSAGEFYTPPEAGEIISKVMQPEPGMEIYDPCCGSGGLLVKCEVAMEERAKGGNGAKVAPLKLYGQEYVPETWAMAKVLINGTECVIETACTNKHSRFCKWRGKLDAFEHDIADSMWNQGGLSGTTTKQMPISDFDINDLETYFSKFGQPR
jgi:type I restriction enzyme M protein